MSKKTDIEEVPITTYRVEGFTCSNCAAKFEQNVKAIEGVSNAQVNFGAAKLTVEGHATLTELEKAGAFENLRLFGEQDEVVKRPPFWKQKETISVYSSACLLLLSLITMYSFNNSEPSLLSTVLVTLSILIGGYRLFIKGLSSLIKFDFNMNTLMTIAIVGAAAIGEWTEGAIVVILFAISEALERYSMDKARYSIQSLVNLAPKRALIKRRDDTILVEVNHIQIGEIMIVKPGEKLALDGVVVNGLSTVNQASITGESIPVTKQIGDDVFAGTLNENGMLEVKVTKHVKDTTLAKIIHLVEEAQAKKAPTQTFIDRFAKYYTPIIMLIALLIAVIPPLLFNGLWSDWIYRALSILVVGCPCALVISTPIVIVTAIGTAAKHGVLIKGGIYVEEMAKLHAIAFDKTGTLTKGVPVVTDVITFEGNEREQISIAAALEKHADHPLASAIVRHAEQELLDYQGLPISHFQSFTGKGISANINNTTYYIGSPAYLAGLLEGGMPKAIELHIYVLQNEAKTVVLLGTTNRILQLIAIADDIRQSVRETIAKLHHLDITDTILLTGDNMVAAQAIGKAVGINNVKAELLPDQKLAHIDMYRRKQTVIAMVGDGINDAPALASANIGIAMGGAGTDTALETANIVLMADELDKLPFTIKLSRKALTIIKQNISVAFGLKVLALLLILTGTLNMWLAIVADMGATLIVLLNSLRLINIKQ